MVSINTLKCTLAGARVWHRRSEIAQTITSASLELTCFLNRWWLQHLIRVYLSVYKPSLWNRESSFIIWANISLGQQCLVLQDSNFEHHQHHRLPSYHHPFHCHRVESSWYHTRASRPVSFLRCKRSWWSAHVQPVQWPCAEWSWDGRWLRWTLPQSMPGWREMWSRQWLRYPAMSEHSARKDLLQSYVLSPSWWSAE